MTTHVAPAGDVRATDITGLAAAARAYAASGSARALWVLALLLLGARLVVGDFGIGDVVVATITVSIAGPIEWIIHRGLLHAPPTSWTSRTLGTGIRHREHHIDPADVDWLMLRTRDATVFVAVFGIVAAAWTLPLLWAAGSDALGPFLTSWALAAIGLAHYEWVHLLVHTGHRCRTRYYARLQRNHRLHHFRNEHHWLGITTSSGDRLFRTYPADRAEVPVSGTARRPD